MGSPKNTRNAAHAGGSVDDGAAFKVYGSVFKTDPRYEFLNPLGKGSYGIVCAAKDRETGQRLAIKKVCPMAKRTVDAKHTLREVLLLQLLGQHPNIISIHNLSTNLKDDELYIVMDLMDTDMHRVIQSSQTLSESHVKYFLHQLLRGVKYLHDNGVLHRDLKPGNLLLTKTCQLKIADFGLARKALRSSSGTLSMGRVERPRSAPATSSLSSCRERAPMTEHVVTRWYRAPELMLQPDGLYDESIDMWSVGCIFAEILGRKALFPGKNFLHQLTLIFDIIGTPPSDATARIKSSQAQRFLKSLGRKPRVPFRTVFPSASDEALDLLERLLEFDPEKRISAQEALAHPYMQPIERKYKGIDPHPSARVDFSFDTKKLTKMDLRAIIIKEVESFRRSVAHTAAVDADLTTDSTDKSLSPTASAAKVVSAHHSGQEIAKQRPTSASAGSRVMCGSAAISMIHSTMRQRLDTTTVNSADCGLTACTRPSSGLATTTSHMSATIGSSRQRIRSATKPPVPKQPEAPPCGTSAGESQTGFVRIVAAQDTKTLLTSLTDTEQDVTESQGGDMVTRCGKPIDPTPKTRVPPPNSATTSVGTVQHTTTDKTVAPTALSGVDKPVQVLTVPPSGDTLMTGAGITLTLSKVTTTDTNTRPEISHSPTAPPPRSSASSSSASDNDDDPTNEASQHSFARRECNQLIERVITTTHHPHGLLRRGIVSAGPFRSKSTDTTTTTSIPKSRPKQNSEPTTFVGSTTSLIRAQRSNNGKSLAASADQMVATMTERREVVQSQHEHYQERRDESTTVEGSAPTLKPQRSTTQLNQLEPNVKKPTRKLTVPKSPKFSVMSWQKKKELKGPSAIDPVRGYVVPRRI